ncbi:hypothetical protein KBC89_00425 [Candidatus Woesebacteria bacterium]|nr:hypothetical protein [Candidatus Woesebacteria bacterium]
MSIKRTTPILIVSSTEGHLSMANSIESGLKSQGFSKVTTYIENSAILPYRLYYRYAPSLHKLSSVLLGSMRLVSTQRKILKFKYNKLAKQLIAQHHPEIVISTNYALNSSFEALMIKSPLRYLTVICDPRSYNLINVTEGKGINLVFDEKQKQIISRDFSAAICENTGWFVRPEFQPPASNLEAKMAIGVDSSKFCALLVAGSEGMLRIQNTVKALMDKQPNLTIVVACGKNQLLYQTMKFMAKQLENSPMQILPLSFTSAIAPYFQAADIIMGKAGPNMIFEAVACHKPFFATTSLGGQETGNLDMIKELGIGFVETDPEKAVKLLVSLVNDSTKITKLGPKIKELAEYNQSSVKRLIRLLNQ